MSTPIPREVEAVPCRKDPERMFPAVNAAGHEAAIAAAKAVCNAGDGGAPCPFRDPCLAYALANDVEGVWGGTTYAERRAMRAEHGIKADRLTVQAVFAEPHGTAARYRRHLRDGEKACGPCTEAQTRRRLPENNSRRAS